MYTGASGNRRRAARLPGLTVIRSIGIGALAGLAAGLVVGGLGGRIAMRISGAMTDPGLASFARTENGNAIGEITLGGTFAMFVFGAMVPSLAAGVLYGALRPWLAPLGAWRGPALGLALLALGGSLILEPTNFDFQRFGSPQVNVLTFATLIVLLGVAVAWTAEMLERRTARERYRFLPWIGTLLVLPLAAGSVATVIEAALEIAAGHLVNAGHVHLLLLPFAFALPLGLRLAGARGRTIGASSAPDLRPHLMSYALVSIPPLLSLPSTVDAIWRLLR